MSPAHKTKIGLTFITIGVLVGGVTIMENVSQASIVSTPDIIPSPTPTATHKKKITKPVVVSPKVTKPVHAKSGGSK